LTEEELCKSIIDVMLNKKSQDIQLFNVKEISLLADYIAICSGTSKVHIQAIANGIMELAKEKNLKIYGCEGMKEGLWILLDAGTVIVHLMNPIIRQFYNLERLWANANSISIDEKTNVDLFLFEHNLVKANETI